MSCVSVSRRKQYFYLIVNSFTGQAVFISIEFLFSHCITVDLLAIDMVTVIVVVVVHEANKPLLLIDRRADNRGPSIPKLLSRTTFVFC